ncbi:alanine acetyltransferase [Bacterioplanes sanyensis]|uniref:ribosomal protein S5-alanine N-acetyltransferase n=1 Tax=Bacterioplanes sanyensis TaxID=1249553 RepID=UPI00167AE370|nr:ribosomal protein S5-alanine N-acetyltransferase [Bacterioplanes sanyensis]GGY48551.1 alanine acetyltransferase [Bacterioplanes sanyensis]
MLSTARLQLEILSTAHVPAMVDYYLRNRQHLAPWEPLRDDEFWTSAFWQQRANASEAAFVDKSAFHFVALEPGTDSVIACCNFTGLARGAFQACFLGYSIDQTLQGQGMMTEILATTVDYMLNREGLNRIMANYMPANKASGRVLEKLGFEKEGYARNYLNIAGRWEDHVLTSKIQHS